MQRFKSRMIRQTLPILLFVGFLAALLFSSCERYDPLSAGTPLAESLVDGHTVPSNVGPIRIIPVDPLKVTARTAAPASLQKYSDPEQYFAELFVAVDEDEKLEVGDGDVGKSKVEFKKYTLPRSYTVFFEWAADDETYTGQIDCREHPGRNIAFRAPVYLELSYEMADLMEVVESSIAAYQFNQATGQWEKLAGETEIDHKRVETTIQRFGKLALFHHRNGQRLTLHKVQNLDFYDREYVEYDHDEKLEVEGPGLDKSFVEIKKPALPRSMTVTFEWAAGEEFSGRLHSVEYGSNVVLKTPVMARFSYKNARLIGVDESTIGLYRYDPASDDWVKVPGSADPDHRHLETYIDRFGSYALLVEEEGTLFDLAKLGEYVFYAKKYIKREKGGGLKLGNGDTGDSKIKFNKHALPRDAEIEFEWAAKSTMQGILNDLTFGPHGVTFHEPAEVELSYRMADLSGIEDESELKIFYFNEETGLWELIGGEVDIKKKKIKVKLPHFSRYALSKG